MSGRHRKQPGRHRKPDIGRNSARMMVGVVPMSVAVAYAGVANAGQIEFIAPQPGVTTPAPAPDAPKKQPGVTTEAPPPMAYVAPQDDRRGVAPETDYLPVRQVPSPRPVAPLEMGSLHAPAPSPQVAVIVPEPAVVRFGDLSMPAPDFLSAEQVAQVNSIGAGPEAEISRFARSVGVAPSRADSVASAAIAGAAQGAAIGCGVGAAMGAITIVAAPILSPIGCVSWALMGGMTGALVGAGQGGLR
ncbi:hypothetical protein ACWEO2_37065 [Nocardia sp. NPDC004278]